MYVLLVEDDPAIAEPLVSGFAHHGFLTKHVMTGADAIAAFAAESFDLVLLDLGLPDMDGLDVCREIRKAGSVPVIMVTARGEEIDRVLGLELGADDYVVKPFGIRELVARVRAVRRRFEQTSLGEPASADASRTAPADGPFVFGAMEIDHRTRKVRIAGQEIALTPKEYGVLQVLSADPGAVVARMSLIEQVWDEHWYGPTKTLDVHVAQIRQKLGNPGWIETVRGVGYRLADPAAASEAERPS